MEIKITFIHKKLMKFEKNSFNNKIDILISTHEIELIRYNLHQIKIENEIHQLQILLFFHTINDSLLQLRMKINNDDKNEHVINIFNQEKINSRKHDIEKDIIISIDEFHNLKMSDLNMTFHSSSLNNKWSKISISLMNLILESHNLIFINKIWAITMFHISFNVNNYENNHDECFKNNKITLWISDSNNSIIRLFKLLELTLNDDENFITK